MLKFGTPTIALPLAIKKCTVQTGCTVGLRYSLKIELLPTFSRISIVAHETDHKCCGGIPWACSNV